MATQVRVAGLVSFTRKVSSVMSTSGGSEQGGEGEGCSQFCMHSTCHKLLMYAHTSVDQTRARSSCTVSIQQLAPHEISVCLDIANSRQWTQPQSVDSTATNTLFKSKLRTLTTNSKHTVLP